MATGKLIWIGISFIYYYIMTSQFQFFLKIINVFLVPSLILFWIYLWNMTISFMSKSIMLLLSKLNFRNNIIKVMNLVVHWIFFSILINIIFWEWWSYFLIFGVSLRRRRSSKIWFSYLISAWSLLGGLLSRDNLSINLSMVFIIISNLTSLVECYRWFYHTW